MYYSEKNAVKSMRILPFVLLLLLRRVMHCTLSSKWSISSQSSSLSLSYRISMLPVASLPSCCISHSFSSLKFLEKVSILIIKKRNFGTIQLLGHQICISNSLILWLAKRTTAIFASRKIKNFGFWMVKKISFPSITFWATKQDIYTKSNACAYICDHS